MYEIIENYYIENKDKHIKRLTFVLGSTAAAEDVMHESMLRACKYIHSYDRGEAFGKWFSRILKNAQFDYLAAESTYSSMEEPVEEESYDCSAISDQVRREIYQRISDKNAVAQEVLNLHYRYGYSPKDIANITPFSYAQCHQIIHRFRKEMQEKYK